MLRHCDGCQRGLSYNATPMLPHNLPQMLKLAAIVTVVFAAVAYAEDEAEASSSRARRAASSAAHCGPCSILKTCGSSR